MVNVLFDLKAAGRVEQNIEKYCFHRSVNLGSSVYVFANTSDIFTTSCKSGLKGCVEPQ